MAFYSTSQFAHNSLSVHPSSQAFLTSSSSSSTSFAAQSLPPSSFPSSSSIPNTTNPPTPGPVGLPSSSSGASASTMVIPPYPTTPATRTPTHPLTLPPRGPFAYHHRPAFRDIGWRFADLMTEYARLGLTNRPSEWRLFDNSTWSLCDTYPSLLVLPAAFSDQDVWTASAHRSKQRLPVVTYRHHYRRGTSSSSSSSSPPLPSDSAHINSSNSSSDDNSSSSGAPREDPSAADKGLGLCPVLTRSAQPMVTPLSVPATIYHPHTMTRSAQPMVTRDT